MRPPFPKSCSQLSPCALRVRLRGSMWAGESFKTIRHPKGGIEVGRAAIIPCAACSSSFDA